MCAACDPKKRHDRGYRKKQRERKVAYERSRGGMRAGEIFIKGCAAMGGDVEWRGEVGGGRGGRGRRQIMSTERGPRALGHSWRHTGGGGAGTILQNTKCAIMKRRGLALVDRTLCTNFDGEKQIKKTHACESHKRWFLLF